MEDQLKDKDDSKIKILIEFICKKYQIEYYENNNKRKEKIKKNSINININPFYTDYIEMKNK